MRTEWPSWLPSLPEGWTLARGRIVARLVQRPPSAGEGVVTAFRDGQVTLRSNRRTDGFTEAVQEIGYQGVRAGELVIHSMDGFAGAMGVSDSDGKMSPVVHIYSVPEDNPYYVAHALRIAARSGFIQSLAKGIRERSTSFDKPTFKDMLLPRPPRVEQNAIVTYLDRETARVDTLIEEQRRLIEMLRERRHSIVDGVFSANVPNVRLRNACIDVVDCPHTTPEFSDEGKYEAVRTASVRNGKFRPGNGLPVDADTWKARNATGAPSVGDVLFTREAPAGEACMVPNDQICLGQRMVLLRIDHTVCVGAFLLWQIYSDRVQNHFLLSANGSTVANVRLPVLRTTPIWLPGLAEQRRIAAYLDEQTAKIDDLIVETEQFIELSKERRSALITAAVTGQIDVRETA